MASRATRCLSRALAFGASLTGCAAFSTWDGFSGGQAETKHDAGRPDAATTSPGPDASPAVTDAAPVGNGIAFVQAISVAREDERLATIDVPLGKPVAAGDLLVAVVGWYDTDRSITSVTDTLGNPYVLAVGPTKVVSAEQPMTQSIFFSPGVKGGADTVKVTWDGRADSLDVRVAEYSGLDPKSPLDVTAAATGKANPPSSGAVTTRFARELLVGAGITYGSFTTPGASYAVRVISPELNIIEDRSVDAIGTYAAEAPMSPPDDWIMQIATFH